MAVTQFSGSTIDRNAFAEAHIQSTLDINNKSKEALGLPTEKASLVARLFSTAASKKSDITIVESTIVTSEQTTAQFVEAPQEKTVQQTVIPTERTPATNLRDVIQGPEFQAARQQIARATLETNTPAQTSTITPKTAPVRQ